MVTVLQLVKSQIAMSLSRFCEASNTTEPTGDGQSSESERANTCRNSYRSFGSKTTIMLDFVESIGDFYVHPYPYAILLAEEWFRRFISASAIQISNYRANY